MASLVGSVKAVSDDLKITENLNKISENCDIKRHVQDAFGD